MNWGINGNILNIILHVVDIKGTKYQIPLK